MNLFGGDADEIRGGVDTDIDGDHEVGFQFLSFKKFYSQFHLWHV
jgi:hypothetical protein